MQVLYVGRHRPVDEPTSEAALAHLFEMLEEHPLDRRFERFGDFVEVEPMLASGERAVGKAYISGNFLTYSCAFRIVADLAADREKLNQIIVAIDANQRRPDYLAQPDRAAQEAMAASPAGKMFR